MAVNAGTIEALLRLRDELTPSLSKASKSLKTVGGDMTKAGQALLPLSAALGAAGVAALKFSTDLNAGMANVATLIPGNRARIEELKGSVQELAKAHGKSTQDLVGGLYQTISAFGDDASQTMEILRLNSMAATAGLASTTDAINLTSAVTKGYGDVTAQAVQKASDLAFTTVKLGQTDFPQLAASIGRVVPVAATLGVKQEELFAGFATLTGVTGSASEVSTQMAGVLRAMLKPTTDMRKAIHSLGFASSSAMLQTLGMQGSLQALLGTTDGTQEAVGKLFGRAEALNAVFALTGEQAGTFNTKLQAMQEAAGATATAFKEQTEGVNAAGHHWNQFKATLEVTAQKLGDALVPAFQSVTELLTEVLPYIESGAKWFAELPAPIKNTAIAVGALIVAGAPLLLFFGQLATSIGVLVGSGGFAALTAAAGSAGITLVSVGTAVATLGAALIAFTASYALTTWFVENTEAGQGLVDMLAQVHLKVGELAGGPSLAELEAGGKRLGEGVGDALKFQEGDSQADFTAKIQGHAAAMRELYGEIQPAVKATTEATKELGTTSVAAYDASGKAAKTMGDRVKEAIASLKEAKLDEEARAIADFAVNGAKLGEIPSLDDLADSMGDLEVSVGNIDLAAAFPPDVIGGLPTLADAADRAAASIEEMRSKTANAEAVAAALAETGNYTAEEIRQVTGVTLEASKGAQAWTNELQKVLGSLGSFGAPLQGLIGQIGGFLNDLSSNVIGKFSGLFGQGGLMSSIMSSGLSFVFGPGGPLMGIAQRGLSALQGLIGEGLKKLGGAIKGLFGGPSAEELAGRDLVAGFEESIIGTLNATQQAEAGGERWKQVVIGVRDAYIAAGHTAAEAEAAVAKLWASSKEGPEATQAAIAEIEAVTGSAFDAAAQAADAAGASTDAVAASLAEMDPEALAATTEAAQAAADATSSAAEALGEMGGAATTTTTSIMSLTEAVQAYSAAALAVPSSITLPTPGGGGELPSFDVGGFVPSDMVAKIHRGEVIVPPGEPRRSQVLSEAGLGGGGPVSVDFGGINIQVSGAGDPHQVAQSLAKELELGALTRLESVLRDRIRANRV